MVFVWIGSKIRDRRIIKKREKREKKEKRERRD